MHRDCFKVDWDNERLRAKFMSITVFIGNVYNSIVISLGCELTCVPDLQNTLVTHALPHGLV